MTCDPARPKPRVLAVIPAFNEEESLPALLEEFRVVGPSLHCNLEVVVIDDGSRDRTSAVVSAAGVRVVRHCRNLGIGATVQTGLRLAFREGFDAAVQVDGDGQHPPGEIARLLARAALPDAPDLVIGSRLLTCRGHQTTPLRRFGQVWLSAWLRLVCGAKITDPTSGLRLYGRRALTLFSESYPYDFPEPEVLAVAAARHAVVVEEGVEMRARQGGRSSIHGLKPVYYMIKVTIAIALAYLRHRGRAALPSLSPVPQPGAFHVP